MPNNGDAFDRLKVSEDANLITAAAAATQKRTREVYGVDLSMRTPSPSKRQNTGYEEEQKSEDLSPPEVVPLFPPPLPPRGNLRLHPAVTRRPSAKPMLERSRALLRQSFPNTDTVLGVSYIRQNLKKKLVKNNHPTIPTVSVEEDDSGLDQPGDSLAGDGLGIVYGSTLQLQSALQASTENNDSTDTTIGLTGLAGGARRPRSLTHQSAGSSHGFSLFGSVDSEQSVPRTAPLATPEQELSLVDMSSMENLPMDGSSVAMGLGAPNAKVFQQQHSLDGISNDIFNSSGEDRGEGQHDSLMEVEHQVEKTLASACQRLNSNSASKPKANTPGISEMNFMDLSLSSSNQESPEQLKPTDTGIMSSNGIGLDSPTIMKEEIITQGESDSGPNRPPELILENPALSGLSGFNIEVTPPQEHPHSVVCRTDNLQQPLPDVVPQIRLQYHASDSRQRKKSLTNQFSSSLETDSSSRDDSAVPLSYDASHSATAIPSSAMIRSPVLPQPDQHQGQPAFLFPHSSRTGQELQR